MPLDPKPSEELHQLAAQVRRLRPGWRDAESFYEISVRLMRLSRRLSREPVCFSATEPRPAVPVLASPVISARRCLRTVQAGDASGLPFSTT
jgi:hypothetical protein